MFKLPGAPDANQHTRLSNGSNREGGSTEQSPQPEWFAIKEPLALNRHGGLYAGRDKTTGVPFKIYTGKRLIDLKRPWFSGLRVDMILVVKAECDVAVLLDLEDNNVAAQCVNRSRRNEY